MADASFTFRVDEKLKTAFTEAARAHDRTGAQLLRDFMRDYLARQQQEAGYDAWFRRKVEAGLAAAETGQVTPSEEVEAYFAGRRAASRRAADQADT